MLCFRCRYFPSKYRREIKRLNEMLEQVLQESIHRSNEMNPSHS
jgi:cytokinin trans-hydroxylase